MPDFFGEIQQQLNDFWQGLDNGQKVKLLSVVGLSILIVCIGVYMLSKPRYEVLYSKLDTSDMSAATKILSGEKISYKISDDGYSLLVQSSKKNDAKFALADANIPKSGATYADAFSQTKLGTTESDKTRQYVEFKASEVANALVANSSSISSAQVFFNIADNSSFLGDNNTSTASVKITPKGELAPTQIEGIARFVANSMQGLDPKNVEVIDNENRVLKDYDDPATGGADKQYTLEQQRKKNIEKEIRDMLSNQSTDYDDVKVVANVPVDFNTESTEATTLEPVIDGAGAVITESSNEENLVNGDTGGVVGTSSNTGTTSYPSSSSSTGSTYSKTEASKSYGYNEKVTKSTKALGQIDKNNSSIAVSLFYGRTIEQAPSQDIVNKVINIISKATGLSNDKISVESFKIAKETAKKNSFSFTQVLQQYGVFAIALILIGLLAFGIFAGPKKIKIEGMPSHLKPIKSAESELEEIIIEEKSEVKKQIDKIIKQKPEAVANLLRNWLTEDWE